MKKYGPIIIYITEIFNINIVAMMVYVQGHKTVYG